MPVGRALFATESVPSMSKFTRLLAGLCGVASLWTAQAGEAGLHSYAPATIEQIGRSLYEQDRRVAIASELVHDNFDVEAEHMIGYVTTGEPKQLVVRYLQPADNTLKVVVDAVFDDLLLPALVQPKDASVSPSEMAQAHARRLAAEDLASRCDGRYNTLAVTDPDGGGVVIYGIAASADPAKVMIGGHVRFRFSADGRSLRAVEPLSTSCAVTTREALGKAAASDGREGQAIRNVLSDTPLESHVLLSLLYDVPLYVVTADLKMWKVSQGTMKVVREQPGEDRK